MSTSHPANVTRTQRITLLWSLGIAAFGVTFLWGFWDNGPFAFGLNAFTALAGFLGLFAWRMRRDGMRLRDQAFWLLPFVLIAASYVLHENPVLKFISTLAFLPLFSVFHAHARNPDGAKAEWDSPYVSRLLTRAFAWPLHLARVTRDYRELPAEGRSSSMAARVGAGLVIFAFVALSIVLPLLSSADQQFAQWTHEFTQWFVRLFEASLAYKIILASVGTLVLASFASAWCRPLAFRRKDAAREQADSVIAGIVIGGTLALYLLFLGLQAKSLLVGTLPADFTSTERIVKSGFWQLLVLTVLNILVVAACYGRTTKAIGRLLTAFGAASLLLLVSAGQRVWLYVTVYGFSYEKFFAAYAVLFCGILLAWLCLRMAREARADVLKFAAFQFLWMYALLTVFPVEQFVLRANMALVQRPGSQIRLYELTMLSGDVLCTVEKAFAEGRLREREELFDREMHGYVPERRADGQADWNGWIDQNRIRIGEKEWYEMTVPAIVYGFRK